MTATATLTRTTTELDAYLARAGYERGSEVGRLMFDLSKAGSRAERRNIWKARGQWTTPRSYKEAEKMDAAERKILGITHAQQAALHRPSQPYFPDEGQPQAEASQ